MLPYLLIKIIWMFGFMLPNERMGTPEWRAINAVTAVIASIGIVLAIAFVRPWGERVPGWIIALPVWVGTGLLVPMVILAPILGPAAISRDQRAGAADGWIYEQVFVMISLVGVGIGLPIALATYVKARWPEAMSGPLDLGARPADTRGLQVVLAQLAATGGVLLGAVKIFWAAGATLGLDADKLVDRDIWWHMLSLSTGVWALVGAWGVLVLSMRRGSIRFVPPLAAAWVASGMLFGYNMMLAMTPDTQPTPEVTLARVLTTELGIVVGIMMLFVVLLVLNERRQASGAGTDAIVRPDGQHRNSPPRIEVIQVDCGVTAPS